MNTTAPFGAKVTVVSGWVQGPDYRGTIDIIWSSFLTIFLCTWTAVCLNVPHPDDKKPQVFFRKVKWMLWAIVGPEIVLAVAIGQYASARRSVRRFKNLGLRQEWTLRHGFFADMGGIMLEPRDSTPFLVNSRQIEYLVQKGYVEQPSITAKEIWDKSKADTLAKTLTLAQASWLAIQLVGRAVMRLSTTTLELSAGAIVLCTFGTYICWLNKPTDVETGIKLHSNATTAQILLEADEAASTPYKHTPLDFVAKESFTFSYDVMNFFNMRCDNRERPLRQFPNDRFPNIGTWEKFVLFCMSSGYAATHLIPWNFHFPSKVELLLWRVSACIFTGVTVFFWVFETIAARQRFGRWDKYWRLVGVKPNKCTGSPEERDRQSGTISKTETVVRQDTVAQLDSFEKEQRHAKPILWWEVALLLPIVLMYALARAYMVVEVFVSLRQVPPSVYQTFEIADLLPHW